MAADTGGQRLAPTGLRGTVRTGRCAAGRRSGKGSFSLTLEGFALGAARRAQAPPTVMPSISSEPLLRPPRCTRSAPTATTLANMSRRFPAMVISSTG